MSLSRTPLLEMPEGELISFENGDQLTQREFHRRYEALPDLKKAELVEGIVFMGSPVQLRRHGRPHAAIVHWLDTYALATPGTVVGDNVSVVLDDANEPQPDAVLLIEPGHGGQCRIDRDDYIIGAPELVVEISASTVSKEYGAKMNVYRRSGIKEYLIWRVEENALDWFMLRTGEFELQHPNQNGLICSQVFPGLWLEPRSLLSDNLKAVLQHLERGIASEAHRAFVAKLTRS